MTTEKEFWEFAGRYFRTVVSIQNIIDELKVSGGLSKDVRAIKAMKRVENVMKEFDEQKPEQSIIKQQNQTLLRIKAELEAIKQCDPFDSVFIAYSVENISNMIETLTEQSTNEECIGCAGPCKVVDVAANLQKELDTCRETGDRDTNLLKNLVDGLEATIEELKDRNIEDLHELYDLYEDELIGIKADRTSIKSDRDIMFRNYRNTVDKLQDDIRGLEVELSEKQEIIDKITLLRVNEVETLYNLKAELSARKGDSTVLMKVVKAIGVWHCCMIPTSLTGCTDLIKVLDDIVEDYADVAEGSPKTPIDDLYKVTVTYAFLEMP